MCNYRSSNQGHLLPVTTAYMLQSILDWTQRRFLWLLYTMHQDIMISNKVIKASTIRGFIATSLATDLWDCLLDWEKQTRDPYEKSFKSKVIRISNSVWLMCAQCNCKTQHIKFHSTKWPTKLYMLYHDFSQMNKSFVKSSGRSVCYSTESKAYKHSEPPTTFQDQTTLVS